jgi:peptidylprolyl isomerase
MGTAKQGDTVRIHYQGTSEDGEIFASSYEGTPVEFTLGEGTVIPGIEEAVEGMSEGESKTIQLTSSKAYGSKSEKMVIDMYRKEHPELNGCKEGQSVRLCKRDGSHLHARIVQISDSTITVDANHPLAGKSVAFQIELLQIGQPAQ